MPQGPGTYPAGDPRNELTPEQSQIVQIALQDPIILAAIAAEMAGPQPEAGGVSPGAAPAPIPAAGPQGPALDRQLLG
jgi:hypothetical protein